MKNQLFRVCAISLVTGLLVSSVWVVWVANAQQPPAKQPQALPAGYVPDLAKPDRDNQDVKPDAQFLADREKIRNTVLS